MVQESKTRAMNNQSQILERQHIKIQLLQKVIPLSENSFADLLHKTSTPSFSEQFVSPKKIGPGSQH